MRHLAEEVERWAKPTLPATDIYRVSEETETARMGEYSIWYPEGIANRAKVRDSGFMISKAFSSNPR